MGGAKIAVPGPPAKGGNGVVKNSRGNAGKPTWRCNRCQHENLRKPGLTGETCHQCGAWHQFTPRPRQPEEGWM